MTRHQRLENQMREAYKARLGRAHRINAPFSFFTQLSDEECRLLALQEEEGRQFRPRNRKPNHNNRNNRQTRQR